MTFANCESSFSRPRTDKNKPTKLFGQTAKQCLAAAGVTFQNHESEFPTTNTNFQSQLQTQIFRLRLEVLNLEIPNYEWTKNPATKPKLRRAKNNLSKPPVWLPFLSPTPQSRRRVWGCWLIVQHEPMRSFKNLIPLGQGSRRTPRSETRVVANNRKRCPLQSSS